MTRVCKKHWFKFLLYRKGSIDFYKDNTHLTYAQDISDDDVSVLSPVV